MALDSISLIDETARRQFEAAWQSGRREPIENFLPPQNDPRYLPTLEELILIELELCWKSTRNASGDVDTFVEPRLEDYLGRFPALQDTEIVERLQEEEASLRQRYGNQARQDIAATNGQPHGVQVPGYVVEEMLGKGAMGIVYRAQQLGLNRLVALKMILPGVGADQEDMKRFRGEAEAVARLQHPHIVQIFEVGEHAGQPFFSLEFVDGGSLDRKLQGEPQPPLHAARLMRTLALAVQAAHERGVVHRDLKPANVLLTRDGVPKITDFGLAKQLDAESGQTKSGAIMGTPCYMAPEQATGNLEAVGAVSDVYALGAMLYEMLTGRPPFRGASVLETLDQVRNREPVAPTQLQPGVPRDLETICVKCLHKEPQHRYASAADLAEDLRRFLDGEPIVARPASYAERTLKWAKRRPLAAALVLVSVLAWASLLGGLFIYALYQEQQTRIAKEAFDRQTTATKLLGDGRAFLDKERLQDASGKFQSAIDLTAGRAELAQIHADASELKRKTDQRLDDEKSKKAVRDKLPRLNELLGVARSYGTPALPGGRMESPQRIRDLAPEGLTLFAGSATALQSPNLSDNHFSSKEQEEIINGSYGLVLLLADAIAQPLPGELADGQAKAALAMLEQAKQLRATSPAWHLRRARYLTILRDEAGAKRERELAASNKNGGSLFDEFLQGYECLQLQPPDTRLAIEHFRKATRLDPDDFYSRFALGVCYVNVRPPQPANAEEAFSKCIAEREDFVWNYLLRGYARTELGRETLENQRLKEHERREQSADHFKNAAEDYSAAETLATDVMARYTLAANRGYLRLLQNQRAEANADFQQAAKLQPEEATPRVLLTRIHVAEKKWSEALEQVNQLVEKWPDRADYYRNRAKIHLAVNRLDSAKADLETAITKEAGATLSSYTLNLLAEDHKELGQIHFRQKHFEDAVAAYDRAIALQNFFPVAHRLRAEALIELQRYDAALVSLNRYFEGVGEYIGFYRLVRKEPVAHAYRNRALAKARVLHPARALEDYALALELEQDSATYAARGWIYIVTDSPRLALPDFEEAIRLDGKNGDAYAGRGQARVMLNQHQNAAIDAELALKHGPRTPRLIYNAARVYAVAVSKAELEQQLSGASTRPLQQQYQERAIALIRETLSNLPGAAERRQFWNDYISTDRALEGIRRTAVFNQLQLEMTR